jgi:hypothetical protein
MWKAGALVLTPSIIFVIVLVFAGRSDGTTATDPRCDSADRAAVTRLHRALEEPEWHATRRLERGVSTLVAARSHCAYGWTERALADYAALDRELSR